MNQRLKANKNQLRFNAANVTLHSPSPGRLPVQMPNPVLFIFFLVRPWGACSNSPLFWTHQKKNLREKKNKNDVSPNVYIRRLNSGRPLCLEASGYRVFFLEHDSTNRSKQVWYIDNSSRLFGLLMLYTTVAFNSVRISLDFFSSGDN